MFFVKGDEVVLKARASAGIGTVTAVIAAGSDPQYEVRFPTGKRVFSERHLMFASEAQTAEADPAGLLAQGAFGDADAFRGFMTLAKLHTPLSDNLYSFAASRTERLAHQFKAVLKLLASPYGRLLIADEVGLGKTIEAGIILTELGARGQLEHIVVACPSPLTEKWRREMRDRFLLDFDVLNGPSLREGIMRAARDPMSEPLRAIVSLELLRRAENLELLGTEAPRFDVVIVDEAHHMRNIGTATNAVGDVLTSLAETVVFLTATPLNLGRNDFYELMRLLVPEEFPEAQTFLAVIEPNQHINAALRTLRARRPPDFATAVSQLREVERTSQAQRFLSSDRYRTVERTLGAAADGAGLDPDGVVRCQRDLIELNTLSHVFTRTRKREVQELFPTRRPSTVAVSFTPPERRFYDAVTEWALKEYEDRAAHLVLVTFQRLAASCLPALGRRLVETEQSGYVHLTVDELSEVSDTEMALDLDIEALEETDVELNEQDRDTVAELVAAWGAYRGRVDSKYDAFLRALRDTYDEGAERVLVFSYFTGTIDYLAERLHGAEMDGRPIQVLKLYGPMGSEEREAAVEQFRASPGPVVLLSSEVGSEGLDFQFCSWMFNYDLPWNPMRVEQRIGRLDRYGQESELIHILNMIVSETIEERIFYRLYERIQIFTESIGDLEAILGDVEIDLARLQRDALSGRLSAREQERRTNLIADVIIRRQQEDEQFEQDSRQFLSNDDVFLDLFNDIKESRRYVLPEELEALVSRYFSAAGLPLRLEPAGGSNGVLVLRGDVTELRRALTRAFAKRPQGARAARLFLAHLEDGMVLTFDPAVATVQRAVEFVSLHHPLIRAVSDAPELRDQLSPCGALRLPLGETNGDPRLFFISELKSQGLKDEVEFVAIVVAGDGTVDEAASSQLLGALEDAQVVSHPGAPNASDTAAAQNAALSWIATVVEAREEQLQRMADEVVAAQLESLRLTVDRRRLWLAEQIENATSEPIVRMRRAQQARLEEEYERKAAALSQKRGVAVSHRMVASGVLVP